jgi:ribonuclease BN (tRNA processing enzyme)
VITHLHPDHALGLPAFVQAAMFPENNVPGIFGPPGTAAFVKDTSLMLSHISAPANAAWGSPLDLAVSEVAGGGAWESPGFIVQAELVHHVPYLVALAYEVTSSGGRVVFSGDTTPLPEVMVPLADGADVLIHECWSTAGMGRWLAGSEARRAGAIRKAFRETHSEVNAVARIAADAGVKRLVLTAEASRTFRGEIVIAEDRLSLEV